MKISRHVELMLELQKLHGDIDVHLRTKYGEGGYTEDVSGVRAGHPQDRDRARGSAIVAVIEGE